VKLTSVLYDYAGTVQNGASCLALLG